MNDSPNRIDLESKLAFLERTVEELSGVLHHEAIARKALEARLAQLESSVRQGGNEVGPQHDPPPHY